LVGREAQRDDVSAIGEYNRPAPVATAELLIELRLDLIDRWLIHRRRTLSRCHHHARHAEVVQHGGGKARRLFVGVELAELRLERAQSLARVLRVQAKAEVDNLRRRDFVTLTADTPVVELDEVALAALGFDHEVRDVPEPHDARGSVPDLEPVGIAVQCLRDDLPRPQRAAVVVIVRALHQVRQIVRDDGLYRAVAVLPRHLEHGLGVLTNQPVEEDADNGRVAALAHRALVVVVFGQRERVGERGAGIVGYGSRRK